MEYEPPLAVSECPETLREREQWVCWREETRDGKPTKVPVTPGTGGFASSTDPETWDAFETALEYTETEHADGVGFVFTDDDPIVGVDLDDCRDPETGDVDDAAQDIIKRLDSYTEVSPSGTGYHVLITGELPEGRNRRGSVELYDTARFSPSLATTSMRLSVALHVDRTRSQRFTASTSRTPSVTQHPSPSRGMALTTSQRRPGQPTSTLISRMRTSSRKRETRRTARSSSGSGTGIRSATTVSPRPIWPCVVCWRSGPVATGRR